MRYWTKEEQEYLENSWGDISIPKISKKLNRTIRAVQLKAYELGLGSFTEQGDYITFNQLLRVLGYQNSYKYLEKRLKKLDFPIKNKKITNQNIKVVHLNDFWKWAEKNKYSLNFAKFEKNSLGLEPDWVDERREEDRKKLKSKKRWTKEEDKLLICLTKTYKYTYDDLKKRLNRTEEAIKKRLYILKVPYRPI